MIAEEQQRREMMERQLAVLWEKLCEETAKYPHWEEARRVLRQLADEEKRRKKAESDHKEAQIEVTRVHTSWSSQRGKR
jgi:hypothetical protein